MTDRIFEYSNSFEISERDGDIEFYVMDPSFASAERAWEVVVTVNEEAGWDSQKVEFRMTREEATRLKEFLISKGY